MAQVRYHKDSDLKWRRIRKGKGFVFVNEKGKPIPKSTTDHVYKLITPPAWKGVVLSSDPENYILAIGTDSAGRKQYIYHPEWIKRNQEHKFDQMVVFGERLPLLRKAVKSHMREHALGRRRIIATVVWLLEHTFIRVGNKTYAEENHSYGLTTMRKRHVEIEGNTITFSFEGKSGVSYELDVNHPRVADTLRACIDLPGYTLFQYLDDDDNRQVVDSADVNDYLHTYMNGDFSAKDFRTWGGSVLAGDSLYKKGGASSEEDIKKNISEAVGEVSSHLGNTKRVCRIYYIHPIIIESYEKNILIPHYERSYNMKSIKHLTLAPEEYATWSLIKSS